MKHCLPRLTVGIACLLLVALVAPAQGVAASGVTNKISLSGKVVDGTRGHEVLSGYARVTTPRSWKRTSKKGARTARFRAKSGSCTAEIQVSGRALASRTEPSARIRSVTRSPRSVIGQGRNGARAWRVVHLKPNGGPYSQDLPRSYVQDPPDVYAIAALRLRKSRWVDVRAFAWFTGCSTKQIRSGSVAKALTTIVSTARVQTRIVRR